MKVLLFCCKGFEMMEFAPFYDVLGWAKCEFGYDVEIETGGFEREVPSAFWDTKVIVDKLISEIDVSGYDALAIPGGENFCGFYEEAYDERFLDLIRKFDEAKKIIASVCVAALPIGKSGVLAGRCGTTYHLMDGYRQKELAGFGVNVVNDPVVTDDNITTSYCPQTAPDVAFELLKSLIGDEKTAVVKEAMGF